MPIVAKRSNKRNPERSSNLLKPIGWTIALTIGAALITLASHASSTEARDTGKPVRFSEHLLVDEHRYTFGIAVVDIDGNGDLDLTCPDTYPAESKFYWLENTGQDEFHGQVITWPLTTRAEPRPVALVEGDGGDNAGA